MNDALNPGVTSETRQEATDLQSSINAELQNPKYADSRYELQRVRLVNAQRYLVTYLSRANAALRMSGSISIGGGQAQQQAPLGKRMAKDIDSLDNLTHLNDVPIEEVERRARPGGKSVSGFINNDERLIDVLKKDWQTVAALGLTHEEIGTHLEKVRVQSGAWFSEARRTTTYDCSKIAGAQLPALVERLTGSEETAQEIEVYVDGYGGHQEDIFKNADGRTVVNEREWCRDFTFTNKKTGERVVVPYGLFEYIKRYGFYEGSIAYRVDPVKIVSVLTGQSVESIQSHLQTRSANADDSKKGV